MIYRFFPFLEWLKGYNLKIFRADFISGLTVALVLIPQSMAYAQLASLPAYYGLYAAFLPPMLASLFGSSRQLATGPVAMVSLMTAAALEPIATAGTEAFVLYAILLSFMVGLFQFLLGVLRLGIVINFISHPVVNGFTNAGALIIATSQLANFFGVSVEKAEHHHYETVYRVFERAFDYLHWPTLVLALLAIGIMYGLKRYNPKIPNVLVAVVITTLISFFVGFKNDRVINIDKIRSESIIQSIENLGFIMENYDQKSTERLDITEMINNMDTDSVAAAHTKMTGNCRSCHAPGVKSETNSVGIVELQSSATSLSVEMEEWKKYLSNYRSVLKGALFSAVEENGEIFYYLQDELNENTVTDGKTWRLKVSNQALDNSALVMKGGGVVIGTIPRGLPTIGLPEFDMSIIIKLLPMVVIISLIGFMEAIAIAKAMAAKTGQRLDANQELVGQGIANIIGSFGKSYPVSGSFSRSAVNIQAGAITGMSGVITSIMVIITLMLFTPLLYHLPQSVLGAIIMMAVLGLVNVSGFVHSWQAKKFDGFVSVVTFVGTLGFAPHLERGIIIGVLLTLGESLFSHMRPDIALLSRHWDGSFRDAIRWKLKQCRYVGVIRFNGSLFFASSNYLEDKILEELSTLPELEHILIVGNGINEMDATGVESLFTLVKRLRGTGVEVSITGLNDSIREIFENTHLFDVMGEDHFYSNVHRAVETIHTHLHEHENEEEHCPLIYAVKENGEVIKPEHHKPIQK